MIELKRLKLINWHNFENVTFDCARLTYSLVFRQVILWSFFYIF